MSMPGSCSTSKPEAVCAWPNGAAPESLQWLTPAQPLDGAQESAWLAQALDGQATAALWTGVTGLVAPLSYRRHDALDQACAEAGARGWPVRLRRSGGGVVPQGPGILNLSLAYPCSGAPGSQSEPVYAHLCALLSDALAQLGIASHCQAVTGSFCDGRFNLAVTLAGQPRKIAGTAQYWRRAGGRQAVLAHALLLVDAAPVALCAEANRFEAALGSERRYQSAALTTVAQAWQAAHPGAPMPADFSGTVRRSMAASLMP